LGLGLLACFVYKLYRIYPLTNPMKREIERVARFHEFFVGRFWFHCGSMV
jgi:hypothetical protein